METGVFLSFETCYDPPPSWRLPLFDTSGLLMNQKLFHVVFLVALAATTLASSGCNSLKDAWDTRGLPSQSEP